MAEERSHEITAKRLAKKFHTEYHSDEGVDIITKNLKIEVETQGGVKSGIQQLQGSHGKVYIAGSNQETVKEALEQTKGTTVGVMDNQGKIIKQSTRKK